MLNPRQKSHPARLALANPCRLNVLADFLKAAEGQLQWSEPLTAEEHDYMQEVVDKFNARRAKGNNFELTIKRLGALGFVLSQTYNKAKDPEELREILEVLLEFLGRDQNDYPRFEADLVRGRVRVVGDFHSS